MHIGTLGGVAPQICPQKKCTTPQQPTLASSMGKAFSVHHSPPLTGTAPSRSANPTDKSDVTVMRVRKHSSLLVQVLFAQSSPLSHSLRHAAAKMRLQKLTVGGTELGLAGGSRPKGPLAPFPFVAAIPWSRIVVTRLTTPIAFQSHRPAAFREACRTRPLPRHILTGPTTESNEEGHSAVRSATIVHDLPSSLPS